ncbi:MAG: sulfate adenylyltransferase subunit CysN [Bacteroidaceae bacterium]|nr:sulfate adenylyltransferase subunit CysN [Bacteroidaceae bacterium]MBQ9293714.1 sulfate adenylyltransferase subunit CysN [Bacteroidaceae bacterium]
MENKQLNIKEYLDADERKSLLRLLTAGSVDDGKSTLIGRLLFDSKKLYEDQLQALERDSKRVGNAGAGEIDYALLLDGLKAEREEGITIDVAYRYFSTNLRKFIIADTPGHEQYTRNMITGGSTANLAIILVDARTGVITQTRRHTFLVSLLGIKHIVLAVNKMDLVDFSEEVFNKIKNEYLELTSQLGIEDVTCFPLSAKEGDNVVEKSNRTPWFEGTSLLQYLETVPIDQDRNMQDFRFPVQYVLRPNLDFRGFSGKVASGIIRKGDEVMALPSRKTSRVKSIVTYDGELDYAFCPQCVTITLEDEIDISRGEMLVKPDNLPFVGRHLQTKLVWMDEEPMDRSKQFFLKANTNTTRATISAIDYRIDVNTMEHLEGKDFKLNEIGQVQITMAKTLFFDAYKRNRATGAFILIDPITNNTCAVGMIEKQLDEAEFLQEDLPTLDLPKLGITTEHYEAIEKAVKELSKQGIEIVIKK